MKQQEKLNELLSAWDNKEKAEAIKILQRSMSETAVTPRVPQDNLKKYVKDMLQDGIDTGSLKDYPGDYSSAAKSQFYKEAIQEVVKDVQEEYGIDNSSHPVLAAIWKECEKARTLIELRKSFRLYITALKSNLYTEEEVMAYIELIDKQREKVNELTEYKRICDEIFGTLTKDDEELHTVIQAKKLKEGGMTDTEICTILNIKRDRLNYLRKKIVLESV